MKKKIYIAPYAAVVNESPFDSILYLSGPLVNQNETAVQILDKDGNRNAGVAADLDFDAKENNLGFSDDWFDYDSPSDL